MKKYIVFLLLTMVILTSCNSKKYSKGLEKNSVEKQEQDNYVSSLKYLGDVCESSDGYYVKCINYIEGKNIPYWCFYNSNTQTFSPLCSKIDCKHGGTIDCDAVFCDVIKNDTDNLYSPYLLYYKGRIYRISYTEKDGTRLLSYDRTGNDMIVNRIIEADSNYIPSELQQTFLIYEDYVYMYLRCNTNEGKKIHRYIKAKIDSNEQYEVLLEYTSTNLATFFYGTRIINEGNKIYMYKPLGGRVNDLHHFAIYMYDTDKKETSEIYNSINMWDETLFVEQLEGTPDSGKGIYSENFVVSENKIYIFALCSGQEYIYCYDILNKQMNILDLEDDNKYIDDVPAIRYNGSNNTRMIVDDKYIYFISLPPCFVDRYIKHFSELFTDKLMIKNYSSVILYVYDKNTLEVVYKYQTLFNPSSFVFEQLKDLNAYEDKESREYKNALNPYYGYCYEDWNIESVDDRFFIISLSSGEYMGLDVSNIGTGNEKWICFNPNDKD